MKPSFPISFMRSSILMLGLGALLILSSCSSTSRTATATYYPYGNSTYSAVFTPPSWAPASENLSQVKYYFIPDCDAYYDASTQQFYSLNNGSWISSNTVPSACSGQDLSSAYTVLLNSNTSQPWLNNAFYQANYPVQSYMGYGNIVMSHNLISGIPPSYSLSPRGFNENTNSVIFLERGPDGNILSLQSVPMNSIATYMPPETHVYYYGGGYRSR
jgi:hypothetical protein